MGEPLEAWNAVDDENAPISEAWITEAWITEQAARIGRSCGRCSLCCKILHIDEPGWRKPPGQWCPDCRPGKGGCSIYATRPELCRAFTCGWLITEWVPDAWFPPRSRMVLKREPQVLNVLVDQTSPDAWRRDPYHADLKRWAQEGILAQPLMLVSVRIPALRREWWITPVEDWEITEAVRAAMAAESPEADAQRGQRWRAAALKALAAQ